MEVLSEDVPELVALARSQGELSGIPSLEGASFPAVLGLATQAQYSDSQGASLLLRYLTESQNPSCLQALEALRGGIKKAAKPSAQAESIEFHRLAVTSDLMGDAWELFCDRFRRRLQKQFGTRGYGDLIKAVHEIADNIFEHAGNSSEPGCAGLAGFHFAEDHAVLSIADVGQGFLSSLNSSAKWQSLSSDKGAVDAVVLEGATSRENQVNGGGFGGLFSCLLEFNVTVFIRTGNCRAKIFQGEDGRKLRHSLDEPLPGSQITIILKRSRDYEETVIVK